MRLPYIGGNAPHRIYRLSNKKDLFSQVVNQGYSRDLCPQKESEVLLMRLVPDAPELCILLKTAQTSITGHGKVKPVLTRKLPVCWLRFTYEKVWVGSGRKSPPALPSCESCAAQIMTHGCRIGTDALTPLRAAPWVGGSNT